MSRRRCLRAPVNEREPIVTEREPEALLIVTEREPKMALVCEPEGLCLQAATLTRRIRQRGCEKTSPRGIQGYLISIR